MKHIAVQMVVTDSDWFNALSEAHQFAIIHSVPVVLTYRNQKSWTIRPDTTADEIEAAKLERFFVGV
jgi:TRAP-type C4-dicarboxylate transport system substrate-binding protein